MNLLKTTKTTTTVSHMELMESKGVINYLSSLSLFCWCTYGNNVNFQGLLNVLCSEVFIYIVLVSFVPDVKKKGIYETEGSKRKFKYYNYQHLTLNPKFVSF